MGLKYNKTIIFCSHNIYPTFVHLWVLVHTHGFCFSPFCDIKILTNFFKKLAKLVEFTQKTNMLFKKQIVKTLTKFVGNKSLFTLCTSSNNESTPTNARCMVCEYETFFYYIFVP
jgi:hypothetical protein